MIVYGNQLAVGLVKKTIFYLSNQHLYHSLGCSISTLAKENLSRAFNSDKELWNKQSLKEKYMPYVATGNLYLIL